MESVLEPTTELSVQPQPVKTPTLHRQHQRRTNEHTEQPMKATGGELPLLRLADSDLTRLGLFISAHTILCAGVMNAGTVDLEDVPHIASKSIKWAFRKNISPVTIRDYLLQLSDNL